MFHRCNHGRRRSESCKFVWFARQEETDYLIHCIKEAQDRTRILDDFSREKKSCPDLNGTSEGAARTVKGAKQIQSQIFNEMMAIDTPKALTTISLWQEYVKKAASRQRSEPFTTLDEYLPYRMTEAAEL